MGLNMVRLTHVTHRTHKGTFSIWGVEPCLEKIVLDFFLKNDETRKICVKKLLQTKIFVLKKFCVKKQQDEFF